MKILHKTDKSVRQGRHTIKSSGKQGLPTATVQIEKCLKNVNLDI